MLVKFEENSSWSDSWPSVEEWIDCWGHSGYRPLRCEEHLTLQLDRAHDSTTECRVCPLDDQKLTCGEIQQYHLQKLNGLKDPLCSTCIDPEDLLHSKERICDLIGSRTSVICQSRIPGAETRHTASLTLCFSRSVMPASLRLNSCPICGWDSLRRDSWYVARPQSLHQVE